MKRFLMKYYSEEYQQEVKLFENLESDSVEVYSTSTDHELLKSIQFENIDYIDLYMDINFNYKSYMTMYFFNCLLELNGSKARSEDFEPLEYMCINAMIDKTLII